jgi:hypothetical protein
MRRGLVLALSLYGCSGGPACEGEACLTDATDSTDVTDPTDDATDPSDAPSDEDTDVGPPADAIVRYEWMIAVWPHAIRVVGVCDGETVYDETDFAGASDTYGVDLPVAAGAECHLELREAQGGPLPAGRVFLCDDQVGTWPPGRGTGPVTVGAVTAVTCRVGCTDPVAENYAPSANRNDGSCVYIDGCTLAGATNYNPAATRDDGTCKFTGHAAVSVAWQTDWGPGETTLRIECDDFALYDQVGFANWNSAYSYDFLVDAGHQCEVLVSDTWGGPGASGSVWVCGEQIASWTQNVYNNRQGELIPVATFTAPDCSGCKDPAAQNYDAEAAIADASCVY